ncbi:beta-galactosidase trimerization domain-containing protein [Paenibacillus sp. FSL H7-0331]|uniref:beta-galactosidase trimerization domain-containing protein n=1 Tax=Paenibacillus sp. FSL H7-0331 TaxID=1920421 RepID=UPI0015C388F7|nr:beta-galactosidase trimerization domain-containing protein [Paenibacillus sp. FSL H7-0331]
MLELLIAFYDRESFIPKGKLAGDAFRGMYYAMLRNRIPFDLVHVGRMEEEVLSRYKVLILPNIGALSDDEAENVRKFVQRGGSVISTYETGVYDEWGQQRTVGVLDDLLGIRHRSPA